MKRYRIILLNGEIAEVWLGNTNLDFQIDSNRLGFDDSISEGIIIFRVDPESEEWTENGDGFVIMDPECEIIATYYGLVDLVVTVQQTEAGFKAQVEANISDQLQSQFGFTVVSAVTAQEVLDTKPRGKNACQIVGGKWKIIGERQNDGAYQRVETTLYYDKEASLAALEYQIRKFLLDKNYASVAEFVIKDSPT